VRILLVEDIAETTEAMVEGLEADGHVVLEANSVEAAREVLDSKRVDCVLLDQLLPVRTGGPEAASEEVSELANDIAEGKFGANRVPLYFIWVTAHEVATARREIAGCLGVVPKEGDTTEDVAQLFGSAIAGFFDAIPPDAIRDQVLVELRHGEEGLRVCVPTWRDDDFAMPMDQLPDWILIALETAAGKPVYLKAKANLRAERPGQLDLGHYRHIPDFDLDEKDLWDG
jgi:CheY-like chemotaxis protein